MGWPRAEPPPAGAAGAAQLLCHIKRCPWAPSQGVTPLQRPRLPWVPAFPPSPWEGTPASRGHPCHQLQLPAWGLSPRLGPCPFPPSPSSCRQRGWGQAVLSVPAASWEGGGCCCASGEFGEVSRPLSRELFVQTICLPWAPLWGLWGAWWSWKDAATGDILLPQPCPHVLPVAGCTARLPTEGWEDGQLSGGVGAQRQALRGHPVYHPLHTQQLLLISLPSTGVVPARGWSWKNPCVSPLPALSTLLCPGGCWGHCGCRAGKCRSRLPGAPSAGALYIPADVV